MFEGFTSATFDFLWELRLNNARPWFLEHKAEFEQVLHRPFVALAQQTLEQMRARFPQEELQVHVSRIYRDARRLFGRGPYCDSMWFSLQWKENRSVGPRFWFDLSPEGYACGLGFWDSSAAFGEAFRRKIDLQPARFEDIIEALPPGYELNGEPYKRPRGSHNERIAPWYNRRRVGLSYDGPFGRAVLTPELPDLLVGRYAELMPLYQFFMEAHRLSLEEETK